MDESVEDGLRRRLTTLQRKHEALTLRHNLLLRRNRLRVESESKRKLRTAAASANRKLAAIKRIVAKVA